MTTQDRIKAIDNLITEDVLITAEHHNATCTDSDAAALFQALQRAALWGKASDSMRDLHSVHDVEE